MTNLIAVCLIIITIFVVIGVVTLIILAPIASKNLENLRFEVTGNTPFKTPTLQSLEKNKVFSPSKDPMAIFKGTAYEPEYDIE